MPNDALVVPKGDHSLGYYDLHTGAERHRLALDPYPRELALSSDGRRGYVCHFGVALPSIPVTTAAPSRCSISRAGAAWPRSRLSLTPRNRV